MPWPQHSHQALAFKGVFQQNPQWTLAPSQEQPHTLAQLESRHPYKEWRFASAKRASFRLIAQTNTSRVCVCLTGPVCEKWRMLKWGLRMAIGGLLPWSKMPVQA